MSYNSIQSHWQFGGGVVVKIRAMIMMKLSRIIFWSNSPGEQRDGDTGGPESVTTPESGSPGLMRKLKKKNC